jgi:multidrug efflux system outer membrane protein
MRFSLLALLLLPACTVGPVFVKPSASVPTDFASRADAGATTTLPPAWWRKLNDTTLNSLISQAASANKDLAIALARTLEARALWRQARLDFAPTVTSAATYQNFRNGATAFGAAFQGRDFELHRIGIDATYELDLFGRVRSSVDAARATTEALEADRQALLLALTAEVALAYLDLRAAQAQLAVARDNAENQAESLRIAEASLKGGRGTRLDVTRATAQWNATLAQIPVHEEATARAIHRLAVLTAQPPATLRPTLAKAAAQPRAPSSLQIPQPAELLRCRPDIHAAEAALEAETARVRIATADLFPRVTFNGSLGVEGTTLANLVRGDADSFTFGPRLSWPAFNLVRVRQQIAAAGHRADAALSRYEQTVLLALEEAENALTAYDRERLRLHYLEASAAAAEESSTLARQRYQDGVSDFLSVLDAQRVALAAQNEIVLSRARVATAWVAIHKALGAPPP